MNREPRQIPCDIVGVLKTRVEYCRVLRELSVRQMELLQADDYSGILEILSRKQRLLEQFAKEYQQPVQLRNLWRDSRDTLSAADRMECERLLTECETVLEEVLRCEQAGTDSLSERRHATQQELQAIAQGAQAHSAYHDCLAPNTHRFLDVDQ